MLSFKTNIEQSDKDAGKKIYKLVMKMIEVLGLTGWFIHSSTDGKVELSLLNVSRLPPGIEPLLATINASDNATKILEARPLPLSFATHLLRQLQPFSTIMPAPISETAGLNELQKQILFRHIKKHAARQSLDIAISNEIAKTNHSLSGTDYFRQSAWVDNIQKRESDMQEQLIKCVQAMNIQELGLPDALYPFEDSVFSNLPVRVATQQGEPRSFEVSFTILPRFQTVCLPLVAQYSQAVDDPFAGSGSHMSHISHMSPLVTAFNSMRFDSMGHPLGGSTFSRARGIDLIEVVTMELIGALKSQLWRCIAIDSDIPGRGTTTRSYERNALGTITGFGIKFNDISDAKISIEQARKALADALDITGLTDSVEARSFNVVNVDVQMPRVKLPAISQVDNDTYKISEPYLSYIVRCDEPLQLASSGRVIVVNCLFDKHPTEANTFVYAREFETITSPQPVINPVQENLYKRLASFIISMKANPNFWPEFERSCIDGRAEVTLVKVRDGFNVALRTFSAVPVHDAPLSASLSATPTGSPK